MINENESKIEFPYTMIQNDFRKANCLFLVRKAGPRPRTRHEGKTGPWTLGKKRTHFLKRKNWTLGPNKTSDPGPSGKNWVLGPERKTGL